MIAARFADSIAPQLSTQAPTGGQIPMLGWIGGTPFATSTSPGTFIELSKHFRYWTYIAINRIANRFAGQCPNLGWVTAGKGKQRGLSKQSRRWLQQSYGRRWIQSPDADLELADESHPLSQLLYRVNAADTWAEFAYESCMQLYLTGKFYWWIIPNGLGIPVELWCIPTSWVTEIYDQSSGQIIRYDIMPAVGGFLRPKQIPPEQIIVGKFKHPVSKIDGLAPLQAGPLWVKMSESIELSRESSFTNGVNPDLIVRLGESYRKPTDEDLRAIKERFIARNSGARRSGEPLVVPPDVEIEKWTTVPKEMAYPQSAEQIRDNVLALHGVPLIIAGVSQDYNRATAEAATVTFCENVMNPLFRLFAGVITEKLCPRFDSSLRAWYDDCRPENADFLLQMDQFLFASGGKSIDELRSDRGLVPFAKPWSESPYLPMNLRPLSEEAQPEPEEDPVPARPAGDESDDDAEE